MTLLAQSGKNLSRVSTATEGHVYVNAIGLDGQPVDALLEENRNVVWTHPRLFSVWKGVASTGGSFCIAIICYHLLFLFLETDISFSSTLGRIRGRTFHQLFQGKAELLGGHLLLFGFLVTPYLNGVTHANKLDVLRNVRHALVALLY